MKRSIQIFPIILIIICISCGQSQKNNSPKSDSTVIIDAICLTYQDLSETEKKEMIFTECCCYPENWNKGENCIDKSEAYYVKAKIDINKLSILTESEAFSNDELITTNPHSLYGKYKNRWQFMDENNQKICETAKFEGHNSFGLIRDNYVDELIIGPLPKKPKKMLIEITDSEFSNITPEFILNN